MGLMTVLLVTVGSWMSATGLAMPVAKGHPLPEASKDMDRASLTSLSTHFITPPLGDP